MRWLMVFSGIVLFAVQALSAEAGNSREDRRVRRCTADLTDATVRLASCMMRAEARFDRMNDYDPGTKDYSALYNDAVERCSARAERRYNRIRQSHSGSECADVSRSELMSETSNYVKRIDNVTEGTANPVRSYLNGGPSGSQPWGFWAGQDEVNPFETCPDKIKAPANQTYTIVIQSGDGWPKGSFSSPSDPFYHTAQPSTIPHDPTRVSELWTQIGAGCSPDPAPGYCVIFDDQVYERVMGWTQEDMKNPNHGIIGNEYWDGIIIDFEYTSWGVDSGKLLFEIVEHIQGLGVKVGFTAQGFGPQGYMDASYTGILDIDCDALPCTPAPADTPPHEGAEHAPSLASGVKGEKNLWQLLDVINPMMYEVTAQDYDAQTLLESMDAWGASGDSKIKNYNIKLPGLSKELNKVSWSQACVPLQDPMLGYADAAIFYCKNTVCGGPGPTPADCHDGCCGPIGSTKSTCMDLGCKGAINSTPVYTDATCSVQGMGGTCLNAWPGAFCKE